MADEKMPQLPMNEAGWDRAARIALGAALFGLGISGLVAEPLAGALRIACLLPFVTGFLGWCPAYQAFGVTSKNLFHRDHKRDHALSGTAAR